MSMVHCMSGILFGCIVWCPSALTGLPDLESFPLGSIAFSMCSFHHQVSRRQRCGRVVPHTSSVVLSSPVLMLFQISSVVPSAKPADVLTCKLKTTWSRPRWLSWMRRPTGDQEVAGSTPAEVGKILSWRLIMKYFLQSFSPFRWFKKGSCQFLAKECAQYWLTAQRTKPAQ